DGVIGGTELQNAGLGDLVVVNRQHGRGLAAKRGTAGRVAERQVDRLVALDGGVVEDRYGERLTGLVVGEGQRAGGGGGVAAGGGRAVARRVLGAHGACAAIGPRHRDGCRALVLVHRVGCVAELQ